MELVGIEIYKRYDKRQDANGSILSVLKIIRKSYNKDGTYKQFRLIENVAILKNINETKPFIFYIPTENAESTVAIINKGVYAARLLRSFRIEKILKGV
jgi:hypothetical protein